MFLYFVEYCLQLSENVHNNILRVQQFLVGLLCRLSQNLGLQFVILSALYPIALIVSYKFRLYLHPNWMFGTRVGIIGMSSSPISR